MVALKPRDKTAGSNTTFAFALLMAICIEPKRLSEPQLSRRLSRWINGIFGFIYGGAIASATLLTYQPRPVPVLVEPPSAELPFDYFVSDEFLNWQEQYQRDKLAALVNEAEVDRASAADDLQDAKALKVIADQGLAASILNKSLGEPVVTTTKVLVSCEDKGDLGWTAVIEQLDPNSPYQKIGSVGNLAECFSGVVAAGGILGTSGEFGVSIRD